MFTCSLTVYQQVGCPSSVNRPGDLYESKIRISFHLNPNGKTGSVAKRLIPVVVRVSRGSVNESVQGLLL